MSILTICGRIRSRENKMNSIRKIIHDAAVMWAVLAGMFLVNFFMEKAFSASAMIPATFVLGVFIISRLTEGYFWGILASLLSVFIINFTFTYPYYAFNFTIPENMASAIVMLMVSVLTSALNTKVKLQEKLKRETEQERMRANLLRAISHDLRTPLTSIYGSTSTVIQHYDTLDKIKKIELLEDVRKDASWLIRMVENLLSITRVGDSKVQIEKSSIVLEELIETVIVKFRKRYPGQKVTISMPETFIVIPMDAILIEQVLLNLLENAVLHAKGMTTLWLNVKTVDNHALIEVADDGCGMPEEKIENLFTGQVRSDTVISDSKRNSMGIGLTVCNTIVKAHGGYLTVKSREGGGMSFCFVLKMEEEDHEQ